MTRRFWETTPLEEMTPEQWESLCDGCAWCCLVRLLGDEDDRVYTTDIACRMLDIATCRCRGYDARREEVPECLAMTKHRALTCSWLPPSCAYRLLATNQPLPHWHPLESGDSDAVHAAGISIRHFALSEREVDIDDLEGHVIDVIWDVS